MGRFGRITNYGSGIFHDQKHNHKLNEVSKLVTYLPLGDCFFDFHCMKMNIFLEVGHFTPVTKVTEVSFVNKELYELVTDENSKKIVKELMDTELRHKSLLEEIGARDLHFIRENIERLGGNELGVIPSLKGNLNDYEVKEILNYALKKESQSVQRYTILAEAAEDKDIKVFF